MNKTGEQKQWCDIICRLPSVINADFVIGDDGHPTELHVLADDRRAAKQISRDIQSALAAKFSVTIDHKIISVAQIPAVPEPQPARIIYSGLDVCHSAAGYSATVTLQFNKKTVSGRAKGEFSHLGRTTAVASATAEALNAIFGLRFRASIEDIRTVELSGNRATIVSVQLLTGSHDRELLVGCCYERGDSDIAVVRSTLDAINRRAMLLEI